MPRIRILQVFCRYLHVGGEELAVQRINRLLEGDYEVIRFDLDNNDWVGPGAPSIIARARRTLYNKESRNRFERAIVEHKPDVALFHNIYPVGSPSLYHAACRMNLPVIQFAHNYRPFSVNGTLFVGGQICAAPLKGNYWGEIVRGSWQNSVIKTALLALAFKRLRGSGWLDTVKAWVCVSDFMREKFVEAGMLPQRVFGLRNPWAMMTEPPVIEDAGYYLFLGRLVEEKGVLVLIHSWDRLRERLGSKTPDLWVGGEGPLEKMVKLASARNPHIKAAGLLRGDAKVTALSRCRAVVIPSVWWEPLGLVTCESYDYSKPVLAASSGGLTETLIDRVTGLLHKPGNIDQLANDVVIMESFPAKTRAAMGLAGRKWLAEYAGTDLWLRKFSAILKKAVV